MKAEFTVVFGRMSMPRRFLEVPALLYSPLLAFAAIVTTFNTQALYTMIVGGPDNSRMIEKLLVNIALLPLYERSTSNLLIVRVILRMRASSRIHSVPEGAYIQNETEWGRHGGRWWEKEIN